MVHSLDLIFFFLREVAKKKSLIVRLFCVALVEQLGDDSGRWYVQLAAIWHRCLALCIYMISSSSVFLSFFL